MMFILIMKLILDDYENITDQLINNKWEYKINNDLFFLILEDNKNYVIDFPALNTKIKSIRTYSNSLTNI